jgi:hypothetical protein
MQINMASKEEMSRIGKSNVRRGKSHERTIAKLLTEWTGSEFRRRRVEGRDSTVIERESTADVIPVSKQSRFSIEVKCGECPSLDAMLSSPISNKITKWWHQATYDANLLTNTFKTIKYYPMLFFKPNTGANWLAIDQEVFTFGYIKPKVNVGNTTKPWMPCLSYDYYGTLGQVKHEISHSRRNKVMVSLPLPNLYFIRWKDFADNVDPSSMFI